MWNILADREIKGDDVDLVAEQHKPLVSRGEKDAYIWEFQDDPGKHYNFYLCLLVIKIIKITLINI